MLEITVREDCAVLINSEFLCRGISPKAANSIAAWIEKYQIDGKKAFRKRPVMEQVQFAQMCMITGDKWPFDFAPWCIR